MGVCVSPKSQLDVLQSCWGSFLCRNWHFWPVTQRSQAERHYKEWVMFLSLLCVWWVHLLMAGFRFEYIKAGELGKVKCISLFLRSVYCMSVHQWAWMRSWTASVPVGSADTGGMNTVPQSLLELLQLSVSPCDWQPCCVKESSFRKPCFLWLNAL